MQHMDFGHCTPHSNNMLRSPASTFKQFPFNNNFTYKTFKNNWYIHNHRKGVNLSQQNPNYVKQQLPAAIH